jgi:hypothetical protein
MEWEEYNCVFATTGVTENYDDMGQEFFTELESVAP